MAIVKWEKDDTVAVMTMNSAENRHNPEWTKAMLAIYDEILADTEIKAIVLTSSDPKTFCLGVDTDWMLKAMGNNEFEEISKWLHENNKVFEAMLMSPVPTIAAITGHAFGNGAMLAGACDFRFMRADRGYFCLPEIDIGIQLAPSMLEWMGRIIPHDLFVRILLTGDRIGAYELAENKVIMKACEDAEKTLQEAIAFAKTFNKSRTTMAEMKKRAYKSITDKMLDEDPDYFAYKPEVAEAGGAPIFMFTPLT
ncbi:MAG TPA: enoyl-CoA hydratase/isomerase family protein [Syntrophomonadaceae bacterium]|nr:enoyl-CoA hydratase/isomerase family protein [Syntrophomonadaceae bacterium]